MFAKLREWIKGKAALLRKNAFIDRLFEQYGFRTVIFAVFSFIISLANAVVNGVTGIVFLSLWYGALGAYYLLLTVMRGGVLLYHRRKKRYSQKETELQLKVREINKYRVCGILLILLPIALSFAILEIIVSDRAFVSSGLMIYVTAMYAFYKIIMSVVNFFKARKGEDFTVRAIINVNLADALVSIFALQTAMFHEFSTQESFGWANAVTGGVVCALTAVMGVCMIAIGSLKIKKLKKESELTNE